MYILYRLAGYLSKVADFDPPHLHSAPPVEFRGDLWRRKTRVPGQSCGFVCMILCLAVLVELRLVTDRQTQGHGYYRGCISSPGKNTIRVEHGIMCRIKGRGFIVLFRCKLSHFDLRNCLYGH